MDIKALPFILMLGLFWGSNLVFSRFGVSQLHPLLFVAVRLIIAAAIFVAIFLFSPERKWPSRRVWRYGMLIGVVATAVPMSATISALRFQSSGVTSVYVTMAPAVIVVMAHFVLPDEQLNWSKGLGVLLALGGALVLVIQGESGLPDIERASPLGFLLVFGGLFGEASGAMIVRQRMRKMDVMEVTLVRMIAAAIVVSILALLVTDLDFSQVDYRGVLSLLYAAIVAAAAAQYLAFYITRRFGATSFSLVGYIVPVVAALTGALLLNEQITSTMLTGMGLIVVGIMLINRRRHVLPPNT
jgi:drug/metabolite transporter (DMT)-like permease